MNDVERILAIIEKQVKKKTFTVVAEELGISRPSLHKTFRPGSDPRFSTILKLCKLLNLKLDFLIDDEIMD